MADDNGSYLLTKKYRELIDAYAGPPDGGGRRLPLDPDEDDISSLDIVDPNVKKSKIKTGPASPAGLGNILRTIFEDLRRIENFWYYVADQPEGVETWEKEILPLNEIEIRHLITLLSRWQTMSIADEEDEAPGYSDSEMEAINSALEPLAADSPEERRQRMFVATELLLNAKLLKIFQDIDKTPPSRKVPNKPYDGQNWRWAASYWLQRRHGLIESYRDAEHCYTLTQRGKAIIGALNNIQNSSIFDNLDESERQKRWLHLIGTGRGLP